MAVKDWSTTANSNSTIDGINIAENAPYANMNDMGRAIMANVREEIAAQGSAVTAATLTTISGASQAKILSGATTISGFDTAVTGLYREMIAGSTLVLAPTTALGLHRYAENISLEPGALVKARSLGAGNWAVFPERTTGIPVVNPTVGKHMIPVLSEAMTPATTNGPLPEQIETTTNKVNALVLSFSGSTSQSAWIKVPAWTSVQESRGMTAEVDWTHSATATGTGVAFSIAALAVSDNDDLDQAVGTAVTITDTKLGSGKKATTAESATVTPAGSWAAGDTLFVRIARLPSAAADDMTADAQVLGARIFLYFDQTTDTAP